MLKTAEHSKRSYDRDPESGTKSAARCKASQYGDLSKSRAETAERS